jgi:hypothetical protein
MHRLDSQSDRLVFQIDRRVSVTVRPATGEPLKAEPPGIALETRARGSRTAAIIAQAPFWTQGV